ncbi:hypothetical protein BC834DRAFT_969723 [Gloeopeniophorella convolvens]|nr:hypothetical protein BC834DRAFT_969723 [Gloeopeniophorella convolvens]
MPIPTEELPEFFQAFFGNNYNPDELEDENRSHSSHDSDLRSDTESNPGPARHSSPAPNDPALWHAQHPDRAPGPDACVKVKIILDCIHSVGWDVARFMNALCWGNSDWEFPELLRRWWKPPSRTAVKSPMHVKAFVQEYMKETIRREMCSVAVLLARPDDPLSLKTLTSLNFISLYDDITTSAPMLHSVLRDAAWSDSQEQRNTFKNPDNVIMNVVSMLSYTRSHHSNRLAAL